MNSVAKKKKVGHQGSYTDQNTTKKLVLKRGQYGKLAMGNRDYFIESARVRFLFTS